MDSNENINIAASQSSINDPFFRYKMPAISVKHEGRGNGVKTLLKNLDQISKSLHREPIDLLQYVASELSVMSMHKNDDYIINGTFSPGVIQDCISRFVSSHVLCSLCENPETRYSVKGKKGKYATLEKTCAACGATDIVPDHKINKRIIASMIASKK